MRRPHLLLFLALSPVVMLPASCTKEGSGAENTTETTGDGDGDPGDGDPGDGDPGDGDPGDGDGDPGCTPGALNCVCDENGMCAPDLACVMGMCTFDNGCTPGTEGCECNAGACDAGLECVNNVCEPMGFPPGPYEACGWNPSGWNACGFSEENPQFPVMCPDDSLLMQGGPCPEYLNYEGCCDMNGNNWWCDGTTFFENCPGGDGDGDGDPTGDGDGDTGDGDGDTGDGDGDTGDGDGDTGP